ncbi:MAG: DTW domain-containing protein [Bdellovibrionales bacterium]|nr:DTW domain-containing protein [Bdellovibrionales bacterium]
MSNDSHPSLDPLKVRKYRTKGKRRTKEPCSLCFLNPNVCMCAVLPKLQLQTRLTLAIHHYELRKTSNTGRLAHTILENSDLVIRGRLHEQVNLRDSLVEGYTPLLLYPVEEAQWLTHDFLAELQGPIQLIVPEGSWRQASKVHYRHKEIADIPRVKLPPPPEDTERLRSKNGELDMATLQAIAYAFHYLEGPEVGKTILDVYNTKVERTLWSRGKIASADCKTFTPPSKN